MKQPADYTKFPFRPFSELTIEEQEEKRNNKFFKKTYGADPEHITDKTIFFDVELSVGLTIEGLYTNKSIDEKMKEFPPIEVEAYKIISREDWERRFFELSHRNVR